MEIPDDCDSIHCGVCRTQVAFIEDVFVVRLTVGIFTRLFNVAVSDDVNDQHQQDANTLANTYCVQCGRMLGWKYIEVTQQSLYVMEGTFRLRLDRLSFDEQNLDQDGDSNEEVPNEQDVGTLLIKMEIELIKIKAELVKMKRQLIRMREELIKTERQLIKMLRIKMETTDQDGDATDQDGNVTQQDGDANEENADQDGDTTEQDLDVNEQNADQDLGVNEQNADQDGATN